MRILAVDPGITGGLAVLDTVDLRLPSSGILTSFRQPKTNIQPGPCFAGPGQLPVR